MNRLQKKCFLFSMVVHGLLALIVLATVAFRTDPVQSDFQIMTLIPARLLDRAGAGGGSPAMTVAPQPQPQAQPQAQPRPQPPPPQAHPEEQPAPARMPEPVERPQPRQPEMTQIAPRRAPEKVELTSDSEEPSPRPIKKHHQIKPTFTPVETASATAKASKSRSAEVSARASETHRLQEIETTLSGLASNVRTRAGQTVALELAGAGGGEAFAGYETAIFNAYFRAWTAPEDLADRLANVDARIVVARDGSVLSAEIVARSGHRELDHSVDQALRVVTKLPPFPESAQDTERTFLIRFNLEAKLSSG
jgi:TonB family protein